MTKRADRPATPYLPVGQRVWGGRTWRRPALGHCAAAGRLQLGTRCGPARQHWARRFGTHRLANGASMAVAVLAVAISQLLSLGSVARDVKEKCRHYEQVQRPGPKGESAGITRLRA